MFDSFLDAFLSWCRSLMSLWKNFTFTVGGIDVSLFAIFCGAIIIGFAISVFWKGART